MNFSDKKHVQTEVPLEQHKQMRMYCIEHGITLNILLQQIVAEWIKNNITLKEVENGQEENDKNF